MTHTVHPAAAAIYGVRAVILDGAKLAPRTRKASTVALDGLARVQVLDALGQVFDALAQKYPDVTEWPEAADLLHSLAMSDGA